EEHASRLEAALAARALDIRESRLVPRRLSGSLTWMSLDDAFLWDGTRYVVLTNDRLGGLGAKLVDTTIGVRRVERLEALHVALLGHGMKPSDEALAGWIESVASSLLAPRVPIEDWNALYEDIVRHFEATGRVQALQGRKILIDQEG